MASLPLHTCSPPAVPLWALWASDWGLWEDMTFPELVGKAVYLSKPCL